MSIKNRAFAALLVSMTAMPVQAWAYGGGGPGCSNLPEYDRAIGALQGLSSCDMSIEEARRILRVQGTRPDDQLGRTSRCAAGTTADPRSSNSPRRCNARVPPSVNDAIQYS